ncbi:MAG: SDR family NAD(P)-dependent oxidoreductase [Pseudomonadota bacterium]
MVAVVTGASAGIGLAFAEVMAREGKDVVLIARRAERLAEIASRLADRFAISAYALPLDLSDRGFSPHITGFLADHGLTTEILVNNAGFGLPGLYQDSAYEVHESYQDLMLGSVAELTHALLPQLCERRGIVINVASVVGLLPGTAGNTLYAATKSWMIAFSESLGAEYENQGLRVCSVCPGLTYSEFHDVNGSRERVSKLPKILWMSAAEVADSGYRAAQRGRRVHVTGVINKLIVTLAWILPRPLIYSLARRAGGRFGRVDLRGKSR